MASSVYPDRNGSIVAVTPPAGDAGAQGPPGMCVRVALADDAGRAEEFAEPDGWSAPRPAADEPAGTALAPAEPGAPDAALVPAWPTLVPAWPTLAGPGAVALELTAAELCALDRAAEAAVAEGLWVTCSLLVAGLNVATDSMAPATRHTARMLASSGITVPGPRNGPVSRRSRRRRRRARCSRW